ncbi:uncharacterized protein ACA1_248800 [Acanthamoeba castellanii str. Neff]|uniref:Uncharacterized protein n=1 Tax=Acanthamoeba castellanii (strain ATCC 30010 / Neff) TaxID=1257118 RepID=L8GXX6_ACACF|nr:uncharacterized protein ACA1_248800 [Acanthamoeba castellanii str. Neff]ELR17855.1 hypothetical protein ACA1_248800 [Acanthamoeba castellanii str. Neff]
MEKVELSSWLVELVSKTPAKAMMVEEVPEVTEDLSSTKSAIEEQSKEDENRTPAEEADEHAWFFEKEFFADNEEAGEGGTKRKIGDEEDEESTDEDEDEKDEDEVEIISEQRKTMNVQSATGQEGKKKDTKGHYACYECGALVPKVAYSNRQRKKKTKRRMKCKKCMVDAVGKNVSTEPLTAAQLYMMNKDRFIGF